MSTAKTLTPFIQARIPHTQLSRMNPKIAEIPNHDRCMQAKTTMQTVINAFFKQSTTRKPKRANSFENKFKMIA